MSTDPHAPTAAGPDPDDATLVDQDAVAVPDDATLVAEDTVAVPVDPAPAEGDWLTDPPPVAAPDAFVAAPPAFSPPGTPEGDAGGPLAQATAVAERPEVQVGLAFLGGAVLSVILKRFGR